MRVLISGSRILAYQLPGRLPRKASVAFSVSTRAPNPSAWTTRRMLSQFSRKRSASLSWQHDDRSVIAIAHQLGGSFRNRVLRFRDHGHSVLVDGARLGLK